MGTKIFEQSHVAVEVPRTPDPEIQRQKDLVDLTMRRLITWILPMIFALSVLSTIITVFLVGFGIMVLSDKVIIALIAETIADIAAILYLIVNRIYTSK
jgi:hypothetical protein